MKQIVPAFRSTLPDSMRPGLIKPSHWNAPLKYRSDGTGPDALVREILTANRDYYVRTDGSDSNDGSSNVSTRAFQTIQRAVDEVATLDVNGFDVTINVADGTYTVKSGPSSIGIRLRPYRGTTATSYGVSIVGNTSTPSNVLLSGVNGVTYLFYGSDPPPWRITGMKLETPNTGTQVASNNSSLIYIGNIVFGNCAERMVWAFYHGQVRFLESFSINSGGSQAVISAWYGGYIFYAAWNTYAAITCSISGNPINYVAFAEVKNGYIETFNVTHSVSGSVTGARYLADLNGIIFTFGSAGTYFPGDFAGSATNGGLYL